jgi:ribosomal-protein-alanine N-acetyltransferase
MEKELYLKQKEVVKYGFEVMKLHSIEAVLDPENYGSASFRKKWLCKEAH